MKFLIDSQGLHEGSYELPKHAYNHTKSSHFIGEEGRSVTVTDLLYDYQGFNSLDHIGTCQRLIGRELVFEGFHVEQIIEMRLAIELGHVYNNWQPMADMLMPEYSLKRKNDHDSAQQ